MTPGPESDSRRRRVLVVDDEAAVVSVVARLLERMGHAVAGASTAEQALEFLKTESFDVILLDIELPGMTGFQALERFAEVSKASVVLISGYADEEFRKDALLLGTKGLIGKPFGAVELKACLSSLPF
ncbi:MAG: response regulator [Elusimicrobiota bacterium]